MTSAQPLKKRFFSTASPWEARIGYYRAVRHGDLIWVSGTTSADPNSSPSAPRVRFPGDAKRQACLILEEIIEAIQAVGAEVLKVFRKEDCGKVGEAFREILGKDRGGQIGAAATMIVANGFVDDSMLVEIEADAVADLVD
ncbi:hypothetical protein N7507_001965 [Penicillium longicatenatum]|nr:hypothetical protein N7507_001965 [Penicillium longicatenatum]